MRWTIHHTTSYSYSALVFLEPHVLRLTPATDATQRLLSCDLQIDPAPVSRAENIDLDGNNVTQVWFEDQTSSFTIRALTAVETLRDNPFEYLWNGVRKLPVRYSDELRPHLAPYCSDRALGSVGELADTAAIEAGGDAQAFPMALNVAIHRACKQVHREEGDPRPAAETLALGEGSCRDLAQVFLEASRAKGYAARFVSGYIAFEELEEPELHAWTEVYLPGGGWRGFDPSGGVAAAEQHIALARAAVPLLAAPLGGSFRGSAVATLTTDLVIEPA